MTSRGPALSVLLAIALAGCGGKAARPSAGASQGTPPDLRGRRVLVLPVQQRLGVSGDADAEIAFGLRERAGDVTWILPGEIEAVLDRSPAISAGTHGLPIGVFLAAEVERIGDPLYGQLRRMSALVDADVVLLPIGVVAEAQQGGDPKVTITAALIDSRTGRVYWFGIVAGRAFPADDPRGLASASGALARRLLWYVTG